MQPNFSPSRVSPEAGRDALNQTQRTGELRNPAQHTGACFMRLWCKILECREVLTNERSIDGP